MIRQVLISAVAVVAMGPLSAGATLIQGELTFSGDFQPVGASLGSATGLTFPGNDVHVDGATGDFALAGIAQGDTGTIYDFTFNPLSLPVAPLWTIGGFQFILETLNVQLQTNSYLILSGSGYLTAAGFANTAGSWNLTANTLGALFNFSSGTLGTGRAVPEPATTLLLGSGLLGLAALRRRQRKLAA